jgi:hypothetical protein
MVSRGHGARQASGSSASERGAEPISSRSGLYLMADKQATKTAAPAFAADAGRPAPAPVTVSRILADGSTDSFVIENPPPRFRIDWETRVAVPVEVPDRRWRRR